MADGFTPNLGVVLCNAYFDEHSFNNTEFTCFIAKYTTVHIRMDFESATRHELQII